ncbi:hypothetical protein BS78_10G231700 [Paspalum vaginatum]|nr:hypothetical protein BS78_10G231700 [Paspalum vaginatum]
MDSPASEDSYSRQFAEAWLATRSHLQVVQAGTESINHLCKDCTFSKGVWDLLLSWFNKNDLRTVSQQGSVYGWWKRLRRMVTTQERRLFDGLVIYFWWELWKERNRRSFQNVERSVLAVTSFVKEDLNLRRAAFGP